MFWSLIPLIHSKIGNVCYYFTNIRPFDLPAAFKQATESHHTAGIGATIWSARNSEVGKEEASESTGAKAAGDADAVPIQIEDKLQKLPETREKEESIVDVKETRM